MLLICDQRRARRRRGRSPERPSCLRGGQFANRGDLIAFVLLSGPFALQPVSAVRLVQLAGDEGDLADRGPRVLVAHALRYFDCQYEVRAGVLVAGDVDAVPREAI